MIITPVLENQLVAVIFKLDIQSLNSNPLNQMLRGVFMCVSEIKFIQNTSRQIDNDLQTNKFQLVIFLLVPNISCGFLFSEPIFSDNKICLYSNHIFCKNIQCFFEFTWSLVDDHRYSTQKKSLPINFQISLTAPSANSFRFDRNGSPFRLLWKTLRLEVSNFQYFRRCQVGAVNAIWPSLKKKRFFSFTFFV